MTRPLDIVIAGLSITSSWGNGQATTWRSLVRALAARDHRVLFLERDFAAYEQNRDLPAPPWCRTQLYGSFEELESHTGAVRDADVVIVGSHVPDGVQVADWVLQTAAGVRTFYDIDTPVTLAALGRGKCPYLTRDQVTRFDLYLSFTGGPVLRELEESWGSPCARPLHCSIDPLSYTPGAAQPVYDLGYLGTYSEDRQPALERLLLEPARRWPEGRFVVAGAQFPDEIDWPPNVERIEHLPPPQHPAFYASQRFTLNLTRTAMIERGYSPGVRLFEAAACATPVITDRWFGLHDFFADCEIIVADGSEDVLAVLQRLPEQRRSLIGRLARLRVLERHTSTHRAAELEYAISEAAQTKMRRDGTGFEVAGRVQGSWVERRGAPKTTSGGSPG